MPTTSAERGHTWPTWPVRLGCPVWACKEWAGSVYPRDAKSTDHLKWYGRTFNAVEGNSTFYGMPSTATFERWATAVPEGFAFCFKFPQQITHEASLDLRLCQPTLDAFLERLEILDGHHVLGTTFLQLGPAFSGHYQNRLESFLAKLPPTMAWAVEVRHANWFDSGRYETWFDQLLTSLQIDRVLFDSSPLYSLPPRDAIESESQKRKPRSPLRTTVTARAPFLRLIGRNRFEEIESYWDDWSQRIADWITAGMRPTIFLHAPDDAFAPQLTREMHGRIGRALEAQGNSVSLPPLPTIEENVGLVEERKRKDTTNRQLRLFES